MEALSRPRLRSPFAGPSLPPPGELTSGKRESSRHTYWESAWHRRKRLSSPATQHPLLTDLASALPSAKRFKAENFHNRRQIGLKAFAGDFRAEADDTRMGTPLRGMSHSLVPPVVPSAPEFAGLREYGLREMIHEPMVQAKAKGNPAGASQGDIVARQIDPPKSVVYLKVVETMPLVLSKKKIQVHKVRDAPFGAGSDRLGNQCVRGGFIPLLDHREYMHNARLSSSFVNYQFSKTNQAVIKKGPNKNGAVEESRRLSTHRLDVLSIMAEWPPLTNRTLVIDLPDSLNKCIAKWHLPQLDAHLYSSPDHIPGFVVDLLRPPGVIC